MINLIIDIDDELPTLTLRLEEEDYVKSWQPHRQVGLNLLINLEQLLAEKELKASEISRIGVVIDPEIHTSRSRAGQVVADILAYGIGADLIHLTRDTNSGYTSQSSKAP